MADVSRLILTLRGINSSNYREWFGFVFKIPLNVLVEFGKARHCLV